MMVGPLFCSSLLGMGKCCGSSVVDVGLKGKMIEEDSVLSFLREHVAASRAWRADEHGGGRGIWNGMGKFGVEESADKAPSSPRRLPLTVPLPLVRKGTK